MLLMTQPNKNLPLIFQNKAEHWHCLSQFGRQLADSVKSLRLEAQSYPLLSESATAMVKNQNGIRSRTRIGHHSSSIQVCLVF